MASTVVHDGDIIMLTEALTILDEVIWVKSAREKRFTKLLKNPSAEIAEGWWEGIRGSNLHQ